MCIEDIARIGGGSLRENIASGLRIEDITSGLRIAIDSHVSEIRGESAHGRGGLGGLVEKIETARLSGRVRRLRRP